MCPLAFGLFAPAADGHLPFHHVIARNEAIAAHANQTVKCYSNGLCRVQDNKVRRL